MPTHGKWIKLKPTLIPITKFDAFVFFLSICKLTLLDKESNNLKLQPRMEKSGKSVGIGKIDKTDKADEIEKLSEHLRLILTRDDGAL